MQDIHAHEILHMMEGNSYATKADLHNAIVEKFGNDVVFHTCSAKGLGIDEIILFLESKGKFKEAQDGFTMDINKVCKNY